MSTGQMWFVIIETVCLCCFGHTVSYENNQMYATTRGSSFCDDHQVLILILRHAVFRLF